MQPAPAVAALPAGQLRKLQPEPGTRWHPRGRVAVRGGGAVPGRFRGIVVGPLAAGMASAMRLAAGRAGVATGTHVGALPSAVAARCPGDSAGSWSALLAAGMASAMRLAAGRAGVAAGTHVGALLSRSAARGCSQRLRGIVVDSLGGWDGERDAAGSRPRRRGDRHPRGGVAVRGGLRGCSRRLAQAGTRGCVAVCGGGAVPGAIPRNRGRLPWRLGWRAC
jgi:hypothetical protein